MDADKFERMVKQANCTIHDTGKGKHRREIHLNDIFISDYAITHNKGSKDIVLAPYVKNFKTGLTRAQAELTKREQGG